MTDDGPLRFVAECCEALDVELSDLLGKDKSVPRLVQARHAIVWATRERFAGLSWSKLGRLLKRDHSTLMHSAWVFADALQGGAAWALAMRTELEGKVTPLEGLETILESLCARTGLELSGAIEINGGEGA